MIIYNLDLLRSEVPRYVPKQALRIMKLTIIIISTFLLQVSAKSHAQKVSLKEKNASLETIISSIREQTGYDFIGNAHLINMANPVNIEVSQVSLEDALRICFKNQDIIYTIEEKTVVLKPKDKSVLDHVWDYFARIEVRGTVKDSDGNPLPGVVVTVAGTSQKVSTNAQGSYIIKSVDDRATLIFSMVGYVSQSVAVAGKKTISVQLVEDNTKLDEVVVIGYTTVKRSDLTGSIGQVNVEDLSKAPVLSFDQALAGRVAGVQVTSGDGQPGSEGINIVIRGAGSLTQSTSPLYVIDGFAMESFDPASISVDDISSFSVLKDASATAIYGARGANGVIVIETKKGKVGAPVVSYNGSFGFQQVTKQMDMMSPYEFVKYQVERGGVTAARAYTPGDLGIDEEGYKADGNKLETYRDIKGINWQDQIFQTGSTRINTLSLRGGTAQTKYSVSSSLYGQDGVIINSGARRFTGRLSVDQTINPKVKAGINVSYSNSPSVGQITSANAGTAGHAYGYLMYATWGFRPITGRETLIDDVDDGFLEEEFDEQAGSGSSLSINPVQTLKNEDRKSRRINLNAVAYVAYDINKQLTFKQTGGYNAADSEGSNFYNSKTNRASPLVSNLGVQANLSFAKVNNWISTSTLQYRNKFNKVHSTNFLAGAEFQQIQYENYGYGSQLIPNESLGLSGMDEGLPISQRVTFSNNTLASFFGSATYDYKSKYFLTATYRADGSSKFSEGNKWAYFPSGALAWKISNEPFMKNIPVISDAKLRGSFGLTGNNRVSDFAYLSTITGTAIAQSYSFQNGTPVKGMYPNVLGNVKLKWETTVQTDLGLDLSLFKGRLELITDVYRKTTEDLLLNANLPESFGFSRVYKNIGKLQNEGVEFTLNTINLKGKKLQWSSSFNISFNRNKVLALTNDENRMFSQASWDVLHNGSSLWVAQVGQPVALFMGYIFDGVYQYEDFNQVGSQYVLKPGVPNNGNTTTLPGDIKYKDLNNDGTVNGTDQAIIGNPTPKHQGGFGNDLQYMGFNLNVFFQWSYGNEVFNANRIYFEGGRPQSARNQFASYSDRWTPDNPSNTQFRSGGQGELGRYSSKNIEDGSYLRLKTVSLSYSLPARWTKKINVKNFSLNATAQNLHTWTNYTGMDPEVSTQRSLGALTPGFDWSAYPRARTIVFGIKATL
jgi:TonB-linked SusC/RagA family outer membrane protein